MDDILIYKDGRVVVRDDFQNMKEVVDVYNSDKRPGGDKPWYNSVIDYLYLVYSPNSPFAEMFLVERRDEYVKMRGNAWEKFEQNPKVAALIKKYNSMYRTTFLKRSLATVRRDIEELHDRISKIPYEIDHVENIRLRIPREQGSDEMIEYPYKIQYKIDNTKRKEQALQIFKGLYDLISTLTAKVEQEEVKAATSYETLGEGDD